MVNQKMQIELIITTTNGNSNTNTGKIFSKFKEELEFRTVDKKQKIVMCNKGRAMARLFFHLINKDFIDYRDLGWLLLKYDLLEKNKASQKEIIEEFIPRVEERD